MRRVVEGARSVPRDGPIVGYGTNATYRYRSFRGIKHPLDVAVVGRQIRVSPAFLTLRYELDVLRNVLPVDCNCIIVDAGGNIGTAALQLSEIWPEATIVVIEPSDANFEMLSQNISGWDNVHAIKAALFAEGGRSVSLHDRGTGEWGFSVALEDISKSKVEMGAVETISLDDISERFPGKTIGLMKLDIEAAEESIFENPSQTMRDIPAIFAELHDRIVPGCAEAFASFSKDRWVVKAGGEKFLSLKGKPDSF